MIGTIWNIRLTGALMLLSLSFAPLQGWAANECAIEFRSGSQTMTKSLSAGQTFSFSPAISGLSWIRNRKVRPVDVLVTNLGPGGPNPKWVTLPILNARDPLAGSYSGNVKLYTARCPNPSFPDVQQTPVPGGSVPIPYPKF